jgi:hypothetical protein
VCLRVRWWWWWSKKRTPPLVIRTAVMVLGVWVYVYCVLCTISFASGDTCFLTSFSSPLHGQCPRLSSPSHQIRCRMASTAGDAHSGGAEGGSREATGAVTGAARVGCGPSLHWLRGWATPEKDAPFSGAVKMPTTSSTRGPRELTGT